MVKVHAVHFRLELGVPTIVRLTDSIEICMYPGDHDPPHFHVLTGDGRAFMVRLDTLTVLAGAASARAFALAVGWADENRAVLVQRWRELNG